MKPITRALISVSDKTGIVDFARELATREIEILSDVRGRPVVLLHGRAHARAKALGLHEFAISLSHERTMAVASVVAWGGTEGTE